MNLKELCQCKIAALLRDLEVETNCLVKSIEIADVDITAMSSHSQQLARTVSIDLQPSPRSYWATGGVG